jgi:glycosyltransferase involved in cell wall biosynthesis
LKDLSVIIPSYKDPLVVPTIKDILSKSETNIEIIVVIDGYKPSFVIPTDNRVKVIVNKRNVGMRESINIGVANSEGKYLMRTDEHCMFDKGFDRIILETIKDNWIVVPKRKFLDTEKFEVMEELRPIEFEKLVIIDVPDEQGVRKFSSERWNRRSEELKEVMIAENMAYQGSCWFASRNLWNDVIVRLESEGYGTHYQDSTEMSFKTWQSGGFVMLNKNTWYAHKHRKFPRTHSYGGQSARDGWEYALKKWEPYYNENIKPRFNVK